MACGCKKAESHYSYSTHTCDECYVKQFPSAQIDAKDVFYKIKNNKDCFSNLEALGILKGENLESILEILGRYIRNFNYFDLRDNIYEAEDFADFMQALQKDIENTNLNIINFLERLEAIDITLQNINSRLNKLEKPGVTDTRGLGFTQNDSIIKVLQKLSDNE